MSKILNPETMLQMIKRKFNDPQVFISEIIRAFPILLPVGCSIELSEQLNSIEEKLHQLFIRGTAIPKDDLFQEAVNLFFVNLSIAEAVYSHLRCFSDFSKAAKPWSPPGMCGIDKQHKSRKPSGEPQPFDRRVDEMLFLSSRR